MYAILRTKKIKSLGALLRSAKHTFREQPTPNADQSLQSLNRVTGVQGATQLANAFKKRLPEVRRRDAVICIEYMITASPEAFCRHGGHLNDLGSGYFKDALRWLQERHGDENVLSAVLHLDERTPHLVAYVVPLTPDGRLSARDYLGGPAKMRGMQDSFYSACGVSHGLQRGIPGSKATHQAVSTFYRILSSEKLAPALTAKDYALKAIGYKTQAWKDAEQVTKALAKNGEIALSKHKRMSSRQKKLEMGERNNAETAELLRQEQKRLSERERVITERERILARREPELTLALAKAEGMERLVELLRDELDTRRRAKPQIHKSYSFGYGNSPPLGR